MEVVNRQLTGGVCRRAASALPHGFPAWETLSAMPVAVRTKHLAMRDTNPDMGLATELFKMMWSFLG